MHRGGARLNKVLWQIPMLMLPFQCGVGGSNEAKNAEVKKLCCVQRKGAVRAMLQQARMCQRVVGLLRRSAFAHYRQATEEDDEAGDSQDHTRPPPRSAKAL